MKFFVLSLNFRKNQKRMENLYDEKVLLQQNNNYFDLNHSFSNDTQSAYINNFI